MFKGKISGMSNLKSRFHLVRVDVYWFLLIFTIYIMASLVWLKISVAKMLAFHAFVYDLGVAVSSEHSIALTHSIVKLSILVPASKPFTLLIAYLTYINGNPAFFLGIQAFGVLLASVFIYLILARKTGSHLIPLLISLSFLFFFPLSWYLFFDFHIAGFFMTFFFAGLYFYDKHPRIAFVLFLIGATTSIVLAIFLFVYLLVHYLDVFFNSIRHGFKLTVKKTGALLIMVFSPLPTILFAYYQMHLSGLVTFEGGASSSSGIINGYLQNITIFFDQGFIVILIMVTIILTVIVLLMDRKDWIYIVPILPVMAFIFFGGYPFYNIKVQYNGEYFTPIIYFLIIIGSTHWNLKKDKTSGSYNSNAKLIKRSVAFFVIFIILIGIFYNPYGPFNSPNLPGENAYADFGHQINVTPSDVIADSFVKLVPSRDTVLVQDDEPQFSDRPRNFLFGPGNLPWLNTSFFYDDGPRPASVVPQFIAVDVNGYVFGSEWYNFPFYNSSDGGMSTWFPYFYSHYSYGLLAYSYPFYLYELNYTGKPVIDEGMNLIGSSYVDHESTDTLYSFNGTLYSYTLPNTVYKAYLLPGNYELSFGIQAEHLSGNISIVADNGLTWSIRSYFLSDASGNLSYTVDFSVQSPCDYTFGLVSSGLTGRVSEYSREYLDIYQNPTVLNITNAKVFNLTLINPSHAKSPSYPMMISISPGQVDNLNNISWNNVAFYYDGNSVPSWLMGINSGDAEYWIKVPPVPGHGSDQLRVYVFGRNTSVMNGVTVGEAPELSSVYAEYDNGYIIFGSPTGDSGYFNFAGTSLDPDLNVISGGFGYPSGSYIIDNGLYLIGNTNGTPDFEAIGTAGSVSNSAMMGWGFSTTNNSQGYGLGLNGPDLGGYSDNIVPGNSTTPTILHTGNTSYTTTTLKDFPIENDNHVDMTYGVNSTVSIYANGKTYYVATPNYNFNNYVGAGVSYSSATQSQEISPEIYYLFVVPYSVGYFDLNYQVQ